LVHQLSHRIKQGRERFRLTAFAIEAGIGATEPDQINPTPQFRATDWGFIAYSFAGRPDEMGLSSRVTLT
jgi:hypothetical protein